MGLLQQASLVVTPNAYKASKLYSVIPTNGTGDLDVVRATSATRVNSAGLIESVENNIPRLDYTNASCPSILVEPQRTNLVFPSDIAATQTRTVTAVAHTLSFYGTGSVTLSGVATGTLNGTGANNRVTLTFTPTAGSLVLTVTGSVTNWQLEAGSNATSLIQTVSTSVTRNADLISKSGISSLIGQTQGTLYWEGRLQGQSFSDGIVRMLLSISNGTNSNRIEIYRFNNIIYYDNIAGGAGQFSGPVFTITDFTGQPLKLAMTYTLNNVKVFINGVLINTDTTALIPACNQINIGSDRAGVSQWSGLIKGTVLLPLLTNTQAIQLTTL